MTLYEQVISINNLRNAYVKARKNKTRKKYVIEFEKRLEENLERLHHELLSSTYKPEPLKHFIIKDPKTRRINKSAFRDRVVHHAACNIIEPLFYKRFINDSYANRKGKGTLKALKRLDQFKQKATINNSIKCYALKADIKHYFETVNHEKLLKIISKVISDRELIDLIKVILDNYQGRVIGCGMPLGNLTSQFFANVYLNELDQYVKHFNYGKEVRSLTYS
jgi:retron-type reverse transcriptase